MPAVTSYSPTGNTYIDGLLDGTKWAVNSFTFSFPTRASFYESGYGDGEPLNNFGALNTAQQAAVRSALTLDATVANISFHEIAETATQHADLRYAQSARIPQMERLTADLWTLLIKEIDAFPRRLCHAERHHETNRDDSVDSVLPPPPEALRPFLKPNTCLLSFKRKSKKSDPRPLHVSEIGRMIRKS